ncbi:MAG TPA: ferredoxin [Baekduia sp.]|nr:ferredoxin [Baekduia sp.]
MTLRPVIDPGACALHGDCADIAPDVFDVSGDVAVVIGDAPDDLLREAADACPSGAILLVEAATVDG